MKTITFLLAILLLPFTAAAQLQNMGFEEWTNPVEEGQDFGNKPVAWEISNGRAFLPNSNSYFPPVTVAHSGDYAIMLGIWYNYTKDMATQNAPLNSRPVALKGHYKYTDNRVMSNIGEMDDQASAIVHLLKWNTVLSRQDTIGSGEILLNAADTYTEFICPIIYRSNDVPDSVTVILDCSLMNRSDPGGIFIGNGGVGSLFTVDSVELVEESLDLNKAYKKDIVVYPNPVKDVLRIADFNGNVHIYDAIGKLVSKQDIINGQGIFVANLTSGMYLLQLNDGAKHYHKRFIKQ